MGKFFNLHGVTCIWSATEPGITGRQGGGEWYSNGTLITEKRDGMVVRTVAVGGGVYYCSRPSMGLCKMWWLHMWALWKLEGSTIMGWCIC